MLNTKDMQKLTSIFTTKEELKMELAKTDFSMQEMKAELRQEMTQHRNDILDKLDAVFGEIKVMRQEQTFHFQKHLDIDDRLDALATKTASLIT